MTKIYSIGIIGGVDYRLHAISIELMGNSFVSVRVVKSLIRTPSENLNWKREKHYSQQDFPFESEDSLD